MAGKCQGEVTGQFGLTYKHICGILFFHEFLHVE